jgi:hypothetical protein
MPVSGAAPDAEPDADTNASNAPPENSLSQADPELAQQDTSEGQGSAIHQPARSLEEESAFSAADPDGGCPCGWMVWGLRVFFAKCTKPFP